MGELIAQNPSLTMQNTLAVNGLRYELDLQAGFFKKEIGLQNNSGNVWYAQAKIQSSEGWAGSASLYLKINAPNNPNRIKLLIPTVRSCKYIGLCVVYSKKTADFFVTFEDDSCATVYFRFDNSVTSAYLKCSSQNASFDLVNEPSGVAWVAATGNISNI